MVISKELVNAKSFALADQLERAVLSIGNNLSEGYGRAATGERLMLLFYADGSAQETKNCLLTCCEHGRINETKYKELNSKLTGISIGIIELANWILNSDPQYTGLYRDKVNRRRAWRFKNQ